MNGRDTFDMLYGKTQSGLTVPRSALAPQTGPMPARGEMPKPSRQVRRWMERKGIQNKCQTCGRTISMSASECAACSHKCGCGVVIPLKDEQCQQCARAAESGLIVSRVLVA
jgi:hypothetical protein